jgi:hypothetical protein
MAKDVENKTLLAEMEESLKRFEPEGDLHRFKNTVIYDCFRRTYRMYRQKIREQYCSGEKTAEAKSTDFVSQSGADLQAKRRDFDRSQLC